jgi:hypothetical protein
MRALAFVLIVACSDKQESAPTPAPAPAPQPPTMPPAPRGEVTARSNAPSCDVLLPAALRDRYFAGAKVDGGKPGRCNIALADGTSARITALCNIVAVAPVADALKTQMASATELPGVGQRALLIDGGSFHQVTAWDTDSPCQLTLNMPKPIDVAALARDVLALLPAA